MARPRKHPSTGVYWLRRGVPDRLRSLVGKTEEKFSLDTCDANEARRRHAKAMAEIDARWASLEAGERSLSEREANELAKPLEARWIKLFSDEPSQQTWYPDYYEHLTITKSTDFKALRHRENIKGKVPTISLEIIFVEQMRNLAHAQARFILEQNGIRTDTFSQLKLVWACAAALQRASLVLAQAAASGEPVPINDYPEFDEQDQEFPDTSSVPELPAKSPVTRKGKNEHLGEKILISSLLAGWWTEAEKGGFKPSTRESYSHAINAFIAYVEHNDARSIKPRDIVGFKDFRLSTPSKRTGRIPSAKTVKDSDLAGLKAVFGWATRNGKIATNPAAGITIKVSKPLRLRSKGFTEVEAKAILTASMQHQQGAESTKIYAAKRWVPWLCAFTGARVGEIAQLRKEDIRQIDECPAIYITPEAGTVKTNQARMIALHTQLVQLGFLDFVANCTEGHLFLKVNAAGDVLKALQTVKNRLAEFGRKVVNDDGVAPNHGWRHRFKTIGYEHKIESRVLDTIQGHASRSVSDSYGEISFKVIKDAILKLPYIEIASMQNKVDI